MSHLQEHTKYSQWNVENCTRYLVYCTIYIICVTCRGRCLTTGGHERSICSSSISIGRPLARRNWRGKISHKSSWEVQTSGHKKKRLKILCTAAPCPDRRCFYLDARLDLGLLWPLFRACTSPEDWTVRGPEVGCTPHRRLWWRYYGWSPLREPACCACSRRRCF